MERHLGARPDHQTVIFIPISQRYVWFDVRLLHLGHHIFLLKNPVSFCKTFFDIPNVNPDFGSKVFSRVGVSKIDIFRFVVNADCAFFHRVPWINNDWQGFIGHINQ